MRRSLLCTLILHVLRGPGHQDARTPSLSLVQFLFYVTLECNCSASGRYHHAFVLKKMCQPWIINIAVPMAHDGSAAAAH
jgi:hypothetical protein